MYSTVWGGVWCHRRDGGLRQINTCREVPLQVNFVKQRQLALLSISLIFSTHRVYRLLYYLKTQSSWFNFLVLCWRRRTGRTEKRAGRRRSRRGRRRRRRGRRRGSSYRGSTAVTSNRVSWAKVQHMWNVLNNTLFKYILQILKVPRHQCLCYVFMHMGKDRRRW